ncbi:ABC transporter ATP-binding protein/permease [Gammaproteobacteria bacterium]|nr:ABC transporter ATP-binding protein/permease [Gammaproteobacteria bacterium]
MEYLKSLKFLLGRNFNKLVPLTLIFLISSLTDVVSIGLIGGYLSMIVDPSLYKSMLVNYPFLSFLTSMEEIEAIIFVGYILVAIFFIKFIFLIFTNFLILQFATQEQAKIQKLIMKGVLDQDYENFILSKGGDTLASIANYSSLYRDVLTAILQLFSNAIVIAAVCIMLSLVSIKILLILMSMLIVIFLLYNSFFTSRINFLGEQFSRGMTNIMQVTSEISQGIKELKTLGKEAFFLNSVNQSANMVAKSALRLTLYSILPKNIIELMLISFIVLIISLSLGSENNLGITLSILGIFAASMIRIAPLVSQVQTNINTLIFGRNSVDALAEIMRNNGTDTDIYPSDIIESNKQDKAPHSPFQSLVLDNVSYTYPNSDIQSLKNITLRIDKGDFIGLVGPSGAGKTTLVDLMLGFLKPSSGLIQFNQVDVHKEINKWRSYCAYLPQEIFLLDGTLEQNITLERTKVDSSHLASALKLSKLESLVNDLPNGLDTSMGDKGVRLSGGQKQRVAIARSIYNKREVLILDESTSALDSETEKAVIEEILTLRNEKTIIAIAHRVSTLKECNKIFRLNNGSVEGPFSFDEITSN